MAFADISQRGRRKTMIRYSIDEGLSLVQADTKNQGRREIPLTAEDLDLIAEKWPIFRAQLENADAINAAPATSSQPASKASPGQGNSPSSRPQGSLL